MGAGTFSGLWVDMGVEGNCCFGSLRASFSSCCLDGIKNGWDMGICMVFCSFVGFASEYYCCYGYPVLWGAIGWRVWVVLDGIALVRDTFNETSFGLFRVGCVGASGGGACGRDFLCRRGDM